MKHLPSPLRLLAPLCLLIASTSALADATVPTADLDGAADPAWLQRYEGSLIVSYEHRGFDAVKFPASKLQPSDDPEARDAQNNRVFNAADVRAVEGEYTRLVYVAPADRSPLEVLRGYLDVVEEGGGQAVYQCADSDCGGDLNGNDHGGGSQGIMELIYPQNRITDDDFSNGKCATGGTPREQRYALATLPATAGGGERTLAVYTWAIGERSYCDAIAGRTGVLVVAIETKAREHRMVTVTADAMASALDADGHIALYGIQFDTNKSTLKPESVETIAQIAALLQAQPQLKLDIVGHTDDIGGADANLRLSQRRADAVVTSLVEDHGIAEDRLTATGAGMAKPVADNTTEEGRAKNRRVELVRR